MDKLAEIQKVTDRTMKFPYTLTAQIRQFPYRFYWQNQWIFRYWCISTVLCLPVFAWIQGKARSPAAKAAWAAHKKKEAEAHH